MNTNIKHPALTVLLSIVFLIAAFLLVNKVITSDKPNSETGEIGDYVVSIKDYQIVTRKDDNKSILIVTYAFTNNDKESHSFKTAIDDKLFQNGVEIEALWNRWGVEEYYDFANASKEIKKGVTLDVQAAYELSDTSSDVSVELSKMYSDKKLEYTISLQKAE